MFLFLQEHLRFASFVLNTVLRFATTWTDLQGIMLSEISHSKKDKLPYDFTLMWDLGNKTKPNKGKKETRGKTDS